MSLDEAVQEAVRRELAPVVERLDKIAAELARREAAGDGQHMSVSKLAKRYGYHPTTIRRWVESGQLTPLGTGHRMRISVTAFEAFLRAGGPAVSPAKPPTVEDAVERAMQKRRS